jgi:hypothetical protein
MLYVIKLGPLETGEGNCHAYLGIRDDGFLARPVIERSDKEALRALAADSDPGEKLLCEKRLARAGGAFGFETAPMPSWVSMPRAAFAVALALGPLMVPGDPDALHLLCHGATEFLRAAPWRYWDDGDTIEVEFDGAVKARYEAAIMGAGGMEYGVALYKRAGALGRVARNVDRHQMAAAAREDALAVTLDDEPRFAVAALRDAYGLTRVPIPMKIESGGARAIESREVAILGATARLLAAVTPAHREASLAINAGDQEIRVAITMPPSSS